MNATDALARLREPFPESEIRYLPRVWCKACRDSRRGCDRHTLQKCAKCSNQISTAHIDLRYVGHAEATNRLLNVDPAWSWEPLAFDEKGLPQYDANGGLWIRLTVCGVTRLGYGNAEGKRGGDAVKEIIGDAIRNAGMRFGMALDLWTSSDLEIAENGSEGEASTPRSVQPASAEPQADNTQRQQGGHPQRRSNRPESGPRQAPQQRQPQPARPTAVPDPGPDQAHASPEQDDPRPDEREEALTAMWKAAKAANFIDGLPDQFAQSFGHPIEQGTADEFRHARDLMLGTSAA